MDNGDGFLSSDDVFLFLSRLHPLKTNALEEAIATTLDLKCCLEAGALRGDENVERGTEESLRAMKVERFIINRKESDERDNGKKKK